MRSGYTRRNTNSIRVKPAVVRVLFCRVNALSRTTSAVATVSPAAALGGGAVDALGTGAVEALGGGAGVAHQSTNLGPPTIQSDKHTASRAGVNNADCQ